MTSGQTVAVIGAGGIAPSHVVGWQALGASVINFSTGGDAAALCARYGATEVGSLDEALSRADVVDVCTPTDTHAEIVVAAAGAGRHVVCEKPLGLTHAAATSMITACADAGVHLYPAHVVRFMDPYATAHATVASGGIGNLATQRFFRMGGRPGPERGWFADPERSGGLVMDLMIHDLDIARWNAGEVATVYARATPTLDDPAAAVSAHVIMTHTNGVVTQCTAIWRVGGGFTTRFLLAGDDGVLDYDMAKHQAFSLTSTRAHDEGGGYVPSSGFAASPYSAEIAAFSAAIAGGEPPAVSADDGLVAVQLAEAANESIRTGEPVHLTTTTAGA